MYGVPNVRRIASFFSVSFMVKGLEFLADAASEQPFAFRDSGCWLRV